MPIDQTLRGLALEIDASVDPAPEAQPLLEYRFIDLASTQTILARIKGVPILDWRRRVGFRNERGGRSNQSADAYQPSRQRRHWNRESAR